MGNESSCITFSRGMGHLWLRVNSIFIPYQTELDLIVLYDGLTNDDALVFNMLKVYFASSWIKLVPLAIGVFGPWGSGRVIFQFIKKLITKKLKNSTNDIVCSESLPHNFSMPGITMIQIFGTNFVQIYDNLNVFITKAKEDVEQQLKNSY